MRLLIVYGTTDGQTRKIASHLRDRLAASGDDVTLLDSLDTAHWPNVPDYHGVIVAAPIHISKYQPSVIRFAREHHAMLNQMTSAFVSVSLSAAGREESDLQGLARCIESFERDTGWRPTLVHHAAGAFLYTKYGFIKRWALRYIAWRHGAPTDTSQDHELTDWNALDLFAVNFSARIQAVR
jgi:menaquinone-dependent protoporphyrinogen oxidase